MKDATTLDDLDEFSIGIQSIYYFPDFAGIAPYATALAEFLHTRGAEVHAYTALPHYPGWSYGPEPVPRRRTDTINGVRVHRHRVRLPVVHTGKERARYEMSFAARLVARLIPKHDLNIAIVPSLGGGLAAAFWKRRCGIPLAVIVQDLSGPAASQSGLNGSNLVARCAIALESFVLRSADTVIIVSESFRHYLIAYGVPEERIVLCPNWARLEPPVKAAEQSRTDMGWGVDDFIVLHTGNMGYKQGLDQVVAAARQLPEGSPIRFVLLGQGNRSTYLEQQASDVAGVALVDPVPEAEYANVLNAADVLLVCERETVRDMALPSKLAAYFSAGKPVVAVVRPDGATAQELERGQSALLATPNDPDALLATIERLRTNPDRAEALGQAGKAYAAKHLDESSCLASTARAAIAVLSKLPAERNDSRWAKLRRRADIGDRTNKVVFGLSSAPARSALRLGIGASVDHLEALRSLAPDFIVDVGANRGQFVVAAAVACPDATIIALEPLDEPMATLKKVAALFDGRVSVQQAAISAKTGRRLMFVADADDSSSLLEPTEVQLQFAPRSRVVDSFQVQTRRLDEVLEPVTFGQRCLLKIDVQGHELAVLKGAGETLARFDHVFVEVSHRPLYAGQAQCDRLVEFLDQAGFNHRSTLHVDLLEGKPIQSDMLFSRDPSAWSGQAN